MPTNKFRRRAALAAVVLLALPMGLCGQKPVFQAGTARRDVTPKEPVPMWGYASRRDNLSTGTKDPLYADALVIQAGRDKLALVGLDLGRSPGEASFERLRQKIKAETGIERMFLVGSHTHHGPVLELSDEEGKGRGRFDATLRYYRQLEAAIADAVIDADRNMKAARMAVGSVPLTGFNRNRHSKIEPKPVDRDLSVLRLDDLAGKPMAVLVNFAAHPTMLPDELMEFSADYAGALKQAVTRETGAPAIFMQGALGDLSTDRGPRKDYAEYGQALGLEAARLALSLTTETPPKPSMEWREERFRFESRTNFNNPLLRTLFEKAFFAELVANYVDEYKDGVRPRLSVLLLNGDIGMVGCSGEVFSAHAVRLKERARLRQVFFFGLANGYHQYFPTIEAAAEGGYGADNMVSPAAVGAGERMMDSALMWLYQMRGRLNTN